MLMRVLSRFENATQTTGKVEGSCSIRRYITSHIGVRCTNTCVLQIYPESRRGHRTIYVVIMFGCPKVANLPVTLGLRNHATEILGCDVPPRGLQVPHVKWRIASMHRDVAQTVYGLMLRFEPTSISRACYSPLEACAR